MLGAANATLRFDDVEGYTPPRLSIVWLENTLDCRTWTYYCDLKEAMAKLHDLCVPRASSTCMDGRRGFTPQLVIAGPRYMANIAHEDETLGFDRQHYNYLPLAVIQNKMYAATTREIVGDADAKLKWARAAGAVAGFTWLPTQHVAFSARSGIPHYRLPFGVDAALYGRHEKELIAGTAAQPFDVGFTGASNYKYPLREAVLRLVRSLNVKSYLGTWQQTGLRRTDNRSWKALDRDGYVQQIARTKMWVSTTGPSSIVGTRYFEILASGTTMLLCNKADAGVYDGLLEDGKHAAIFDGMDDLRAKILKYLADEPARRRVVAAAADLVRRVHTWDARARFITRAVEANIRLHAQNTPYYVRPAEMRRPPEPFLRCIERPRAPDFIEVQAKRPLRRFTVQACAKACRMRSTHFAVQCGGFCSGNGHRLARCFCAKVPYYGTTGRLRPKAECATACSLHDPRPCGGWDAAAVYVMRKAPHSPDLSSSMAGRWPRLPNVSTTTPYDAGGDMRPMASIEEPEMPASPTGGRMKPRGKQGGGRGRSAGRGRGRGGASGAYRQGFSELGRAG